MEDRSLNWVDLNSMWSFLPGIINLFFILGSCVVDVAILIDTSGSITWQDQSNWDRMIEFAKDLVRSFNVEKDQTRVAVIR